MSSYNSNILYTTVIRWVQFKFVHTVAPPIIFVAWWLKPFLSNVQSIATNRVHMSCL